MKQLKFLSILYLEFFLQHAKKKEQIDNDPVNNIMERIFRTIKMYKNR